MSDPVYVPGTESYTGNGGSIYDQPRQSTFGIRRRPGEGIPSGIRRRPAGASLHHTAFVNRHSAFGMQPWTVKQRRYLLKRDWMKLREDHVVLPSGAEMEEFHVVEYPNWAATVCIDVHGDLVFAEQYRHGVQRLSLELPAGVIETGEAPLAAAQRELLEETGYTAPTWQAIGACATDPSNHSNYAYLFLAKDAYLSEKQDLDAEEEITVRLFKISEVLDMIHAGKVIHGIHLTALLWAFSRGWLSNSIVSP